MDKNTRLMIKYFYPKVGDTVSRFNHVERTFCDLERAFVCCQWSGLAMKPTWPEPKTGTRFWPEKEVATAFTPVGSIAGEESKSAD